MDWLLIGVLLCCFLILGASRLSACVQAVAMQGILLSLLPPLARGTLLDMHALGMFLGTFFIKAVLIPFVLNRSIREVAIRSEVEPIVSLHLSLLAGGALVVASFLGARLLPLPQAPFSPLILPTALSTVLVGFFLLVSRTKAISQAIGFLVMDNGIFLFGMTLASAFPLVVEMGVLLDLLVGVFVMGIVIFHINRTFDHIDTRALSREREEE